MPKFIRVIILPLLLAAPAFAQADTSPTETIGAAPNPAFVPDTVTTTAPKNAIAVYTLYSGQQLLAACTESPDFCKGYVSGLTDTTETFTVTATQKHWCTAMQGTNGEITAVVIKYFTDHPDKLAQSAQTLVTTALTQAYCPAK